MSLDIRYPAISDLRARARARVPHFVFEYLDSATAESIADLLQPGDAVLLKGSANTPLSAACFVRGKYIQYFLYLVN